MNREEALKYKEIAIKMREIATEELIKTFPEKYSYKDLVTLNLAVYSLFNHGLLAQKDMLTKGYGLDFSRDIEEKEVEESE